MGRNMKTYLWKGEQRTVADIAEMEDLSFISLSRKVTAYKDINMAVDIARQTKRHYTPPARKAAPAIKSPADVVDAARNLCCVVMGTNNCDKYNFRPAEQQNVFLFDGGDRLHCRIEIHGNAAELVAMYGNHVMTRRSFAL